MARLFHLSPYSLAAMRIGLGIIFLLDLIERRGRKDLFFGVDSVYALSNVSSVREQTGKWTLFLLSEQPRFVSLFFVISFAIGLCFMIGYQTRLMTVLVWIILLSLHSRTPLVTNGGDIAMRICLFWSMRLPLGARRSIDHYLSRIGRRPRRWRRRLRQSRAIEDRTHISPVASFALMIQLCRVYITNYRLKTGAAWNETYTATSTALLLDKFTTPLGDMVSHYQGIREIMTRVWIWLEGRGWLLLFWPWKHVWTRSLVTAMMIMMHAGMALTMHIGWFAPVMIVWRIAMIPHDIWHYGGRYISRWTGRQIDLSDNFGQKNIGHYVWTDWMTTCILGLLIVYVASRNILNIDDQLESIEKEYKYSAWFLRLDQTWKMFAPRPTRTDGRYDAIATQQTETTERTQTMKVLVRDPERAVDQTPDDYNLTIPYWRFRKLFDSTKKTKKRARKEQLIRALCHYYDIPTGRHLEVAFYKHIRVLNGPDKEIEKETVAEGECL